MPVGSMSYLAPQRRSWPLEVLGNDVAWESTREPSARPFLCGSVPRVAVGSRFRLLLLHTMASGSGLFRRPRLGRDAHDGPWPQPQMLASASFKDSFPRDLIGGRSVGSPATLSPRLGRTALENGATPHWAGQKKTSVCKNWSGIANIEI